MPQDFDLSPRLQTLASSLFQQALNGAPTTAPPVPAPTKRKYKKRRARDEMQIVSPFTVAAREIAMTSGVPMEEWLNRSHPLNDQLYERMRELAGVSNAVPRRRPSNQRSIYV